MIKLEDTKRKTGQGEAYFRCFGNKSLATILSRTQAMIIKNGTDLEKMILERVNIITDLDQHFQDEKKGIFVVPKKNIKKSKIIKFDGVEPDFMVFIQKNGTKACHVVELKDGCEFDTKSSEAEIKHLCDFIKTNASKIQYTFEGHICCFNESTKESIVKGFKNKIKVRDAMTGQEFCNLLEIDYDEIVRTRKKDQKDNLEFFLLEIITGNTLYSELKNLENGLKASQISHNLQELTS